MPVGPLSPLPPHEGRNRAMPAAAPRPPIVLSASRRFMDGAYGKSPREPMNFDETAPPSGSHHGYSRQITWATPIQNPIAVPMLEAIAMTRVRVTGLRKKPR